MKRLWLVWSTRLDAMARRERLLVTAAALVGTVYLGHVLFVDPALSERRALTAELAKQRAQIVAVDAALRNDALQRSESDAARRSREGDLKAQLATADEIIKSMYKGLVPAQRMPILLRDMLARDPTLQLQSLRSIPASVLVTGATKALVGQAGGAPDPVPGPEAGVYKHGVEITVRGSYSALHGYLARLERSPWAMYWWRARLSTEERGGLTMTLTIYTLSLDKAWLEV